MLKLKNYSVKVDNKLILKDINFEVKKNEVVCILGKNGSGKSTLLNSIMKNNKYKSFGDIYFENKKINDFETDEVAKLKIFFSHQNPIEIYGITFLSFLKSSYENFSNKKINLREFINLLDEKVKNFGFDKTFRKRFLNVGFSGGEKKKSELLQLFLFEPKLALLDEVDSGLDINGINLTNKIINSLKKKRKTSFIIVSHNLENIEKLNPDKIFILKNKNLIKIEKKEIDLIKTKGF